MFYILILINYLCKKRNSRYKIQRKKMNINEEEAWEKALKGELKIHPNCILPEEDEISTISCQEQQKRKPFNWKEAIKKMHVYRKVEISDEE